MDDKFQELFQILKDHMDDPNSLSEIAIKLSALLYYSYEEEAKAELTEKKVLVDLLSFDHEGKKTSVAEAEKRAVVQTGNNYGIIKGHNEGVVETINSIKARLKVFEVEKGLR